MNTKITVVLAYPYQRAEGIETFVHVVKTKDIKVASMRRAAKLARRAAVRVNKGSFAPKDFEVLALFKGEPMYLAGPWEGL